MTAFFLLFVGSAALFVALASLVVGRKALRDRRESASSRRRGRYHAVCAAGDREALRKALASVRSSRAQIDLAVVLEDPARAPVDPAVLDVEGRRSGLVPRLQRQLGSRHAPARGRAVRILAHLRIGGRIAALERMLHNEDPNVRIATGAGLALARDDESVGALVRALGHRRLAPERVIERVGPALGGRRAARGTARARRGG